MLYRFVIVMLLLSLEVSAQSRPTGGGPDRNYPDIHPSKNEKFYGKIKARFDICKLDKKTQNKMESTRDLYDLFQKVQLEYLVKAFPEINLETDPNLCLATQNHLSPMINCLLKGSVTEFTAFIHHLEVVSYLKERHPQEKEETIKKWIEFLTVIHPTVQYQNTRQ